MEGFKLNSWENFQSVNKNTMDSGVEETQDKLIKLYNEKTAITIANIQEIGIPKQGEQLRIITKRSFNAIAFVKMIADECVIEDAVFVVYSINYEAAKLINDLIESGRIKRATILISNLRNKAHRTKEQLTKDMFVDNEKIKLIFASSHAKIIAIRTKNDHYVIEGSGNLSYNSRIEQYVIDNDKDMFLFTKNWIDEIIQFLNGKKELKIYE